QARRAGRRENRRAEREGQLPRRGCRLRLARRGQAPGDGQGAVDFADARCAWSVRAGCLERRAGVRVRARGTRVGVRAGGVGRRGCTDAGCAWGGGESPTLPGLVAEGDIELAGAAVGMVPPGARPILGQELRAGDEILLVSSSGLHANGASLARVVAARLPDGYATKLASGAQLGEALPEPSLIYAPLVGAILQAGLHPSFV